MAHSAGRCRGAARRRSDLVALGKIMGGGMPLACLALQRRSCPGSRIFASRAADRYLYAFCFAGGGPGGNARLRPAEIARLGLLGELPAHRSPRRSLRPACRMGQWLGLDVRHHDRWPSRSGRTGLGRMHRPKCGGHPDAHAAADGIYITLRGTGCLSTPMREDDVAQFVTSLGAAIRRAPALGYPRPAGSAGTADDPHTGLPTPPGPPSACRPAGRRPWSHAGSAAPGSSGGHAARS